MPRTKSLLAQAHKDLSLKLPVLWPGQLLAYIDEVISGLPQGGLGGYPSQIPCTPFRDLRIVFDVLGKDAKSIQFWDGDYLLLEVRRRVNAGRLVDSAQGVYMAWRVRMHGPRRLLLDECLCQCAILCEIRIRKSWGEVLLAHSHEKTGSWAAVEWPAKKGLVLVKKGQGTTATFIEPPGPWF